MLSVKTSTDYQNVLVVDLFWKIKLRFNDAVSIIVSQHTNAMTTHLFTCDDDILAFEYASIALEFNNKLITINRCVVQFQIIIQRF